MLVHAANVNTNNGVRRTPRRSRAAGVHRVPEKLLCCLCVDAHLAKEHKGRLVTIRRYAKEIMVPAYEALLVEIKAKEQFIAQTHQEIAQELPKLIAEFVRAREKAKQFLDWSTKIIGMLQRLMDDAKYCCYKELAEGMNRDVAHFKIAVEQGNVTVISEAMNTFARSAQFTNIFSGDTRKQLLISVNNGLEEFNKLKRLDELQQSAYTLCKDYGTILRPSVYQRPIVSGKYVYFTCDRTEDGKRLLRLDTSAIMGKPAAAVVEKLVKIPRDCAIAQIGSKIFISGGYCDSDYYKTYKLFREYADAAKTLSSLAIMKTGRWSHAMLAITNARLAVVGGNAGGSASKNCEEYSFIREDWLDLPDLNAARELPAAVAFGETFLYAIGGTTSSGIERLNIESCETWNFIDIKDFALGDSACATQVSKDEILILSCRAHACNALIFNVNSRKVNKMKASVLEDDYRALCTMPVIGGIAYIPGRRYGHVNFYRLAEKSFGGVETIPK